MIFVPVPGTKVQFCVWETRVQDFEAFVKATSYDATNDVLSLADGGFVMAGHNWKNPGFEQGPTHPVVGVSWDDARSFCAWLTQKEHKAGTIQASQTYRLPTDAEWSCAMGLAREDGKTPEEKYRKASQERTRVSQVAKRKGESPSIPPGTYPWSANWPPPKDFGNYSQDLGADAYPFTAPTGAFPANTLGLYDLSGNVWEWCEDLYNEIGSWRVYRGGSFTRDTSASLASWGRAFGEPNERYVSRGFRVVLTSDL
ncbi:MAG TPA: SUMF1/EgtB/PvdO family nonheme iron enzyme [Candidatus Paceibacterota bacterium]|nr:SUMF1/EgtB/PvdO family nonheme iron enzyme [Verrucomicrobiota bacterium]HSA12734.1 SUMF1/EgtB/PvdO family nonheme iron enzyme [Candidatus Paceibacterota bacterium]